MNIFLTSACLFLSLGWQQPGISETRVGRLQRLKQEVDSLRKKYATAPPVQTDEEREIVRSRYRDEIQDRVRLALQLAQEHPLDTVTFDALEWIVTGFPYLPESLTALDILRRDYIADKRLAKVCVRASVYRIIYGSTEELLREALAKNPDHQVQGIAAFILADVLRDYAHMAKFSKDPVNTGWQKYHPKDLVRKIESADPEELLKEAENLYQKTIEKYGDVKLPGRTLTLEKYARATLFELRFLQIGKQAPDIEGEDLDGAKIKLSDYRGKVVLLVFWTSWYGPCRAAIPHERELVKRFKGRPFVLLGVNGDEKKEAARKAVEKYKIPWRSFWDGKDGDGPIVVSWNIRGFPTIYVLDAKGVIRHKDPDLAKLDAVITSLVAEAESGGEPPK